jgi:L-ascorbate metabolism protein UlaG (beta-lactamase superfamily)
MFGDMKLIGDLYRTNVCFLPFGDRATMGPEHAAIAVELLGAKRVVPIHHSSLPSMPGKPEDFIAEVAKLSPETEVTAMKPGDKIEV